MLTSPLVLACEPIIPLMQLYSWPLSSLVGVIFIKAIWFAKIGEEKGFSPFISFVAMFLANIVTTVIGLVLVAFFAAPMLLLYSVIIVVCISIPPVIRLFLLSNRKIKKRKINLVFWILLVPLLTLIFFGSIIFLFLAESIGSREGVSFTYWITKFAYIYCGLAFSFFLTAVWEELVAGSILKSSFLPEISRMNLYIMLGVWIVFAALSLGLYR
ncbi:hypothetical protein V0288_04995 [Pannus brasiliensis CCIBt3594]|uniref:Uncharacterized protein n=1 Tax=Pannus brasiliensis CCIBt3594 TaxID=1427578 RepID=A0AAW9QHB5_9CHRO